MHARISSDSIVSALHLNVHQLRSAGVRDFSLTMEYMKSSLRCDSLKSNIARRKPRIPRIRNIKNNKLLICAFFWQTRKSFGLIANFNSFYSFPTTGTIIVCSLHLLICKANNLFVFKANNTFCHLYRANCD